MPAEFNLLVAERDAAARLSGEDMRARLSLGLKRIAYYESLGVLFRAGPGQRLQWTAPPGVEIDRADQYLWRGNHEALLGARAMAEGPPTPVLAVADVDPELDRLRNAVEGAERAVASIATATGQAVPGEGPLAERLLSVARGAADHARRRRAERAATPDDAFATAWTLVKTLQRDGVTFHRTATGALGYQPDGAVPAAVYKRFSGLHDLILQALERERLQAELVRARAQAEEVRAGSVVAANGRAQEARARAAAQELLARVAASAEHTGAPEALPGVVQRQREDAIRLRKALGAGGEEADAPERMVRRLVDRSMMARETALTEAVREIVCKAGVSGAVKQPATAGGPGVLVIVDGLCRHMLDGEAARKVAMAKVKEAEARADRWKRRFALLKEAAGRMMDLVVRAVPGLRPLQVWWNQAAGEVEQGQPAPALPVIKRRDGMVRIPDGSRARRPMEAAPDMAHLQPTIGQLAPPSNAGVPPFVEEEDLVDPRFHRDHTLVRRATLAGEWPLHPTSPLQGAVAPLSIREGRDDGRWPGDAYRPGEGEETLWPRIVERSLDGETLYKEALQALSNPALYRHVDRVDHNIGMVDHPERRHYYQRHRRLAADVARARGLDLDSGRHHPALATDPVWRTKAPVHGCHQPEPRRQTQLVRQIGERERG